MKKQLLLPGTILLFLSIILSGCIISHSPPIKIPTTVIPVGEPATFKIGVFPGIDNQIIWERKNIAGSKVVETGPSNSLSYTYTPELSDIGKSFQILVHEIIDNSTEVRIWFVTVM